MMSSRNFRVLLACSASLISCATSALAQDVPDISGQGAASQEASSEDLIVVTGSRIRQDPTKSALPLEIITNAEIERNALSSPEQLNMFLTSNGSGADNLAANADVTTGGQRGINGLSSANLRGQGSAATLVLLNGRRVAAHGVSGGAVDINQIPFAAIDRVEVLKDGASAIYGTDAIGGVINYITKKSYTGIGMTGFADLTDQGRGNIYSLSAIAGFGDLDDQGFNIMAAASYRWNKILRGSDRSFVNGNQPERGLSIDTRGTPIATVFGVGNTANESLLRTLVISPTGATSPNFVGGGINPLDVPGGAGCESMDGGMAYDEVLWAALDRAYACAWDTGRAAVIQQPVETLTYYGRGTVKLGASEAYVEITGSDADSAKSFSHNQLSTSTSTSSNLPLYYPRNALTATTYDSVVSAIRSIITNPAQLTAFDARVAQAYPLAFRWRCIPCGPREYVTNAKTFRVAGGVSGPLPWEGWDYNAGASLAKSSVKSTLGSGYFYRGVFPNNAQATASGVPGATVGSPDPRAPIAPGATLPGIVGLINSGILNPFSLTQTQQALDGLAAISAEGVTLFGGSYKTVQADASISGTLFPLPGGDIQFALGVDYRRETYEFNGSDADNPALQPNIFNAAFDNGFALTPKHRTVKAAYAEAKLPILDIFDITGAVRIDDYSGFGTTTNPKVSARFQPIEYVMLRGSFSTGFRVPSFNQIFNGTLESQYSGADLADPVTCPPNSTTGQQPVNTTPGCATIQPTILTGGNLNLGPETATMYSVGVVLRPTPRWSLSADWWSISTDNTIYDISLRELVINHTYFPERFIRNATTNAIEEIDRRFINSGARRTEGIEFALRGAFDLGRNMVSLGADGSLLLKKKEKVLPSAPFGSSLVGVFSFAGDLGLKWKHNAWVTFANDDVAVTMTQIFRNGYANQALPGSAARPGFNARVDNYVIYNLSASLLKFSPGYKLTLGIKNLFDKDPPFAITYDSNTGAGSSWEPRVADPRGRSFTIMVETKF
jgi:iron complex outermembrane receptor protein